MTDETPTEPILVPTLGAIPPAATELVQVDALKVESAITFLNQAMRESGLQLAQTVSEYVVQTFFDGDAAKLSLHGRAKANSYAALCDREDLEMGAATLKRLVRIGLQIKAMPPALAQALTPGQHRALLVVSEPEHKVELAKAAVAERWTAERLEEVIAARKPVDGTRRGRVPVPELVKDVQATAKKAGAWATNGTFDAEFRGLSDEDRATVLSAVRQIRDSAELVLSSIAG